MTEGVGTGAFGLVSAFASMFCFEAPLSVEESDFVQDIPKKAIIKNSTVRNVERLMAVTSLKF